VVLLLFNRPALTQQVVNAVVQQNPESVYLIADGPRDDHPSDAELCDRVRDIALNAPWSGRVHTNFAETNIGLKNRVSSGLDWVFATENEAIILEDDCLPDPSFFFFANELLDRYRDDDRVGIISGNNFLWGSQVSDDSYFFTPDTRIWGWATWGRVWREFSAKGLSRQRTASEILALIEQIPATPRRQALRYTQRMGTGNSWAQPFVFHNLEQRLVNVMPRVNLVSNIGLGGLSTHTSFESFTADPPAGPMKFPLRHPTDITPPPQLGTAETRAYWRRLWTFPLVHPFDFFGRLLRYARKKLS
jgi:hypothetical protein